MVPTITAQGASFHGAFLYYFHDKGERSRSRIGFTQTLNMLTESVDKAWKVMAYTAKHASRLKEASGQKATGAKLKKAVFAYSLSWHPEQSPSTEEMLEAAHESLEALGLGEHEAMIAEHTDEPHPHLHIVVNKVHPLTGLVAKLKYTKERLSDFALNHERKEGKMYCSKREENHVKRETGKKTKYTNPVIAEAWQLSRNGGEFRTSLEQQGYQLAQGRKCIVIVDPKGKPSNAARELGIKTKEFKAALGKSEIDDLKSFEEALEDLKGVVTDAKQEAQSKPTAENRTLEFEERKATALNEMELRQFDELSALSGRHDRKILKTQEELSTFYNFDKKQLEIQKLETKQHKSGFFQKLFGIEKRREVKLEQLRGSLQDAKSRYDEAINKLTDEKQAAVEELNAYHAEQKAKLERNFEQWKPSELQKLPVERQRHARLVIRDHGPDFER